MEAHRVQWTDSKIAAFWDHVASIESQASLYFTQTAGESVARHLAERVDLADKTVLDFGCGPGHLFPHLVKVAPTARYYGVDFSPHSVEDLIRAWGRHPQFAGGTTVGAPPVAFDRDFDVIVCCEVIEHLDQDAFDEIAAAFARHLRPGGKLYLTTPNAEDLSVQEVMCPDCGGVFHRWQHQRAWTARSLAAAFARHGFVDHRTETLIYGASWLRARVTTHARRMLRQPLPNLCYLGTRL